MLKKISQQLKSGEVSSVYLTKKYLAEIEKKDTKLGAYVSVRAEKALEEAAKIDVRREAGEDLSPVSGIPVAVKDNLCIEGEVVTSASKILENYTAPYSATVIERLKEAGAIIIGKTNLDEFAMGGSTENSAFKRTVHPADETRVPGGSSGGSAVAVAADMAVWSLGSDTGGSVREPASFCGIVGLKPTYGRVSRYGLLAMASSFDQIGTITHSVEDAAIALSAISGEDKKDATSAQSPTKNYAQYLTANIKDMTIGIPKEVTDIEGLDEKIREKYELAIENIKSLGAKIETISLPHLEYSLPVYYILVTSEVSSNMARYDGIRYGLSKQGKPEGKAEAKLIDVYKNTRSEGLGDEVKRRIMLGTYALSAGYYDAYYKKAQQVRALIKKDFETAYAKVDQIFMPTCPEVAFKIGEKVNDPLKMYLSDIFTVTANVAGVPAISIPIGTVKEDRKDLPVGGQLLGKWFDEEGMLRTAFALESTYS